jgi:hypothetical protein
MNMQVTKQEKKRKRNDNWKRNHYLNGMIYILINMNPDLVNNILEFIGISIDEIKENVKQIRIQEIMIE